MTDLKMDTAFELAVESGDFAKLSDSPLNIQDVRLALHTDPGDWLFAPMVGIGLKRMINADIDSREVQEMKRRVKLNLDILGLKGRPRFNVNEDNEFEIEVELNG